MGIAASEVGSSVRLASLVIKFRSPRGLGVPAKLLDWDVDAKSPASPVWTILFGPKPSPRLYFDAVKREAHIGRLGGRINARGALSYPEALLELLIYHGVLPIHAAAFTGRTPDDGATLVSAPSGGGKSSLSWLAVAHGRGLLSDDHIGLRRRETSLELVPLKRSVAVDPSHLRERPEAATEEPMVGGTKLRFDPQSLIANCRVSASPPRRLVFLEKGAARRIEPLSPAEAFTRLVPQSAALLPSARKLLTMLKDLADSTPAVVATLTASCLKDPGVLDELGA